MSVHPLHMVIEPQMESNLPTKSEIAIRGQVPSPALGKKHTKRKKKKMRTEPKIQFVLTKYANP